MKKNCVLLFLLFALPVFAQNAQRLQSLTDLSFVIRDPIFPTEKRREYLEFTRKLMIQELSSQMGVKERDLQLFFFNNPTKNQLLLTDPWIDLQSEFYLTIHQENFLARWRDVQKNVKLTDFGTSIANSMMGHLASFTPREEGRYYQRSHKVSYSLDKKIRSFQIPYFLLSENISDLISFEAHIPYEELIKEEYLPFFIEKTPKAGRLQRQELAEKM
jgi:hypothetical protein